MLQTYTFSGCGAVVFDDSRSVRELIEYAFEEFDYYEPFGMEIVTLFQCHHSSGNYGWFTLDPERSCAEEIEDRDWLCFAYHMPGVFYYAEGGWGHHMAELGNHPPLENPVSLHLRFEEFDHTLVLSGSYSFRHILRLFINAGYLPHDVSNLIIRAINPRLPPKLISRSNPILDLNLQQFETTLPNAVVMIDIE